MSTPRLYCDDFSAGSVILDDSEAGHALRSLRLGDGDVVTLFDGCGHVAGGRLRFEQSDSPSRSRKRARMVAVDIEQRTTIDRPKRRLTLITAAPKGERLRWLIEKCTELGAAALVLAKFDRSIVHVRADQADKLRRYAIEACKQCGRAWLPEIECGAPVASAVEAARGVRFVADLTPDAAPLAQALGEAGEQASVLIGPEGGLSDGERDSLASNDVRTVSLGSATLRIETAAMAVAAVWGSLL